MRRKIWFVAAVALQIVILLVMIGMKWSTLTYGTKIMLKTLPVDPWDPLRGDYVILNYEISQLDLKKLPADSKKYNSNETVYVGLTQKGRYWEAGSVSHLRPQNGTLAIKGTVGWYDEYGNKLFVNYGIDSYYVPQHQGKDLERRSGAGLEAEVSVDKRGDSALSKIFYNGKELKFQ